MFDRFNGIPYIGGGFLQKLDRYKVFFLKKAIFPAHIHLLSAKLRYLNFDFFYLNWEILLFFTWSERWSSSILAESTCSEDRPETTAPSRNLYLKSGIQLVLLLCAKRINRHTGRSTLITHYLRSQTRSY